MRGLRQRGIRQTEVKLAAVDGGGGGVGSDDFAPTIPMPEGKKQQRLLQVHQRRMSRTFWQQPLAIAGIVLVAVWILLAFFAPVVAPGGPFDQIHGRYNPPSAENWFGTDRLGRDIYSRTVWGARVTIPYSLVLVLISGTLGSLLGAIAGYIGGLVDEAIMRLADMFFAFPTIVLALAVAAAIGPGLRNAVIAIVLVAWPIFARVVRSLVLQQRERDYVAASRLLGSSTHRALFVDILPNTGGPVAVLAMLQVGSAVLLLSALSFLGLGAQPPQPEWGQMVSEGVRVLHFWWVGTFPGLAILSLVLGMNLLGDTLRDMLDPRIAGQMKAN